MIKQIIGGVTKKTVYAEMSAGDLTAVQALMEGKLEIYDKKFEGGTASVMPAQMNSIRCSCGKKISKGVYQTASFSVPHITQGKSFADAKALIIGAFDAGYDIDTKCDYSNLIGSKSEVA
ncbi:hypothetical protein [Sulfurospirillum multivorans]|uniref:Uncharacterized protein n=2 Tax=Sulfurospirillum multivorans TaxID=66821 RepID=A0AA86DZW2_SULMK|nr:hypothetical protein [Sulfurospirillum multivorans]AHJ12345.1 hypothetical protein SMUL_1079 [Sulfurospirillum multivorans DSM 12446]AHJ13255.1 hypothetical protein SMUL_2000 [Sulfurospirillum multivorans DSM 12446]QEH05843.1 hypothetical protein SMN_1069 [Sulfurospirillum multivorans]QEH06744.1 hypothetical protein SMN_1979 [Sulfurospirillum multivorans]